MANQMTKAEKLHNLLFASTCLRDIREATDDAFEASELDELLHGVSSAMERLKLQGGR